MLRLESAIDQCIKRIETRRNSKFMDESSVDGSGISSLSLGVILRPRYYSAAKDTEKLKRKNEMLEKDNRALRRKIELLERAINIDLSQNDSKLFDEKKDLFGDNAPELHRSLGRHKNVGTRNRKGKIESDSPFSEIISFFGL